ncbi:MAG: peptidylprolyl isomerase, partial [Polaromonas sp.]|nr:peptidylprolyl isomerase [Polaromonas sp.]
MKKQLLLATAAALMVFGAQNVTAQNIAIVNGKAVPKARLDALAQQVARSGRPMTPEIQRDMREAVITREIFAQEAEKLGLMGNDDYKNQMEIARQTVLIAVLIDDFKKKNAVTDAELKAEYDKFAAANGGKEYKARHILVEKELDAKAIIASIKKGGKFEDLAKKQSKDTGSGANGGDLDWANPTSYVTEFTEAMLKLNKGQMTDTPIKTQFGFHIIRVDDIRNAQLPAFEELKPQIAQQLDQQRLGTYQQG